MEVRLQACIVLPFTVTTVVYSILVLLFTYKEGLLCRCVRQRDPYVPQTEQHPYPALSNVFSECCGGQALHNLIEGPQNRPLEQSP